MRVTKKAIIVLIITIILGSIFIPTVNAAQLSIDISRHQVARVIEDHLEKIPGITFDVTTVSNTPYLARLTISEEDFLKLKELILDTAMRDSSSLADIAEFTHLEKLSLNHAYTISDISALSEYTNLLDLSMKNIWLEQSEISGLETLTTLEKLNIDNNKINNIDFMEDFVNMQELSIEYNGITDISVLSNMPNLHTLTISQNGISDITPINNLTNLTTLNAYKLNNSNVLNQLDSRANLKSLDIAVNSITDISNISKFANLETLSLEANTGLEDISSLESLSNLNWLNIRANTISDLTGISDLTNLKTLQMSGITATDMSNLNKLTNLEWIDFAYTEFEDVSVLENFDNLKYISAEKANLVDGTAIGTLDNLEELHLRYNYNYLKDISFMTDLLDGSNTKLRIVDLSGNSILDFSPIEGISDTINLDISSQRINIKTNKTTGIELPHWVEKASDTNSICYTADAPFYSIENGTISADMQTFDLTEGQTSAEIEMVRNSYGVAYSTINIELDILAPTASVSYSPELSKDKVIVTLTADEEIQPVSGWSLSKDKMTLTKEYADNSVEDVTIIDEAGNEKIVNINVNNIDKVEPNTFDVVLEKVTTNSITVNGSTTDSGSLGTAPEFVGIEKYEGQLLDENNNIIIDWREDLTFTNLTQDTTYKINMRAADKAGNIRQTTTTEVRTNEVPSAISNILIVPEIVGATNQNYNITMNTNITGFDIEYKIGEGDWIKYLNPFEITGNGLIFARFVDNIGQITEEIATLQVKNIDKEAPNTFEFNISKTINSIVLVGNTTDKGSIGVGNEYIAIERYEAQLLDVNNKVLVDWTSNLSFEGLSQGTKYKVNMRAIDKAGNITASLSNNLEVTTNVQDVVVGDNGNLNNGNETVNQGNTEQSQEGNTQSTGNIEETTQNTEEDSNGILDNEKDDNNNSSSNTNTNINNNNINGGSSSNITNSNEEEADNRIFLILIIIVIIILAFGIYKKINKK